MPSHCPQSSIYITSNVMEDVLSIQDGFSYDRENFPVHL